MKVFHCTHCDNLVFFENATCVRCQRTLAYLQDRELIGALDPLPDGRWQCTIGGQQPVYRLCDNYTRENVCNWAIPEEDTHSLCYSCRFTLLLPDLGQPTNRAAWYKLEVAKRRLLYTLVRLGCPPVNKEDDAEKGLAFAFLADTSELATKPLLTGHANGTITINVAEADDVERERRRQQLHEPYRTLLGHFRHETGHYYWDRLIQDRPAIEMFRKYFGDERKDYEQAIRDHYQRGAPPDWQSHFVTAYAAAHPWEDWAETWAHYLHIVDTLETAVGCGLAVRPHRSDEPKLKDGPDPTVRDGQSFDQLVESWFALTYVLNNLNRGLGLPDGYPFVLSPPAVDKLRFVHSMLNTDPGDYSRSLAEVRDMRVTANCTIG